MKIAWIADYFVTQHLGGAQQTNDRMIQYGRELGYEIEEITADKFDPFMKADLMITNNVTTFDIKNIMAVSARIPTIRYDHDIWASMVRPQIFEGNLLNIFLSPLHKQIATINIGKEFNSICIPSPIDTDLFCRTETPKEKDTVLWVGSTAPHKGLGRLIDYANQHPEKRVNIISFDMENIELPSNITVVGEKHGNDLAGWYQKSEIFFHHPDHEAFGRTVMEAYLCGCELNVNKNIGAMSYDWDYNNYDEVKQHLKSEKMFWGEINKLIK